jgi:hypothetical protein
VNAWERIACCVVSGARVAAVERIRYSVLVAVDVAACF